MAATTFPQHAPIDAAARPGRPLPNPAAGLQASLQRPVLDVDADHVLGFELLAPQDTAPPLRPRVAGDISALACDFSMRRDWVLAAQAAGLADAGRALILPINPELASEAMSELDYLLDHGGQCLSESGQLVIQIDEGRALGDSRHKRLLIQTFRRRGYRISISGFGAGFESLKDLLHAGADFLRLSPALTGRVHADQVQRSIVRGLLSAADDLGVRMIADQVASPVQAQALRDLGVHLQQGPLHGPAQPLPQAAAS